MEKAGWPGQERTKDLVKDQSPGSAGNPGYLNNDPTAQTTLCLSQ